MGIVVGNRHSVKVAFEEISIYRAMKSENVPEISMYITGFKANMYK